MGIAHLTLKFSLWYKCCDRVDDQNVNRARTDQCIRDFEGLLTGIGLRDQQLVYVDAEFAGIGGVERVFRVDERAGATCLLALGDDMQCQCGFAISSPSDPVEIVSASLEGSRAPSFMMEPRPNARSIWPNAASSAFCLSISALSTKRNEVCDMSIPLFHTAESDATGQPYLICSL